jgi:uncharacterized protein with FMN-binding domain
VSTRSTLAALAAGAGVLALGWNMGTANSQTLGAGQTATGQTTTGQTATSPGSQSSTTQSTTGQPTTGRSTTSKSTTGASSTPSDGGQSGTNSSGLKDGTYTGQTITHRYGQVTVTVTVSGGRITNLTEQVASDGDNHSDRVNQQAVPMLRSEVLAANSADVNTISGGTYTSEAYLQSLQSALDQAK